jgi:hypothetical protein
MCGTEIAHLIADITHNHTSILPIFVIVKQASLIQSFAQCVSQKLSQ